MGHVSRCLTLARYLENQLRCQIAFVSSAAYPEGVEYIRNTGYEVQVVDSNPLGVVRELDPDIVVVDALNTDPDRMRRLHEEAAAVISLEDTDGGVIYGDFVINALYQDSESKANHFAGPDYFVLREEFWEVEPRLPDTAERVLLTFGGSDPTAISVLACRALACDTDRTYRLILGPEFDHWNELNGVLTDCPNVEVFHDIDKIGEQMAWADMAVASAGRTAYELAATGTPALLIAHNAREHNRGQFLDDQGVAEYLGRAENLSPEKLRRAVNEIAENQALRSEISERGQTFIDGNGARRILDLIHDLLLR
jgi:spore coat polysaccharide biosynthesis predicted glycosyltransferase SpsG